MLGKLGMTVEDCIKEYKALASAVFKPRRHLIPITRKGNIKPKFSGAVLEEKIKEVVKKYHESQDEGCLLYEGEKYAHECKVYAFAFHAVILPHR